jgi:hypothetical protein
MDRTYSTQVYKLFLSLQVTIAIIYPSWRAYLSGGWCRRLSAQITATTLVFDKEASGHGKRNWCQYCGGDLKGWWMGWQS